VSVDCVTLERAPAPALAQRTAWMLPVAAGIFLGSLIFDALPMATAAIGFAGWLWAVGGFGLMFVSSRLASASGLGRMALVASAGVWLHSLLEGTAAGAGGSLAFGGGILIVLGLTVHLIPESVALYGIATQAGLSAGRAFARCAVTWGLVVAGYLAGAQLTLGQASSRPMGAAMGLAAGTFAYLAMVLWQRRSPEVRYSGAVAALGLIWVAAIHLG
jgi:zinc transporter, ZIP family